VDAIAARAQVNKALINYHFRGKSGLYRSVLADLFESVATELEGQLLPLDSPGQRLTRWPQALWSVLDRHPTFAPLLLREILSGCDQLEQAQLASLGRSFALMSETLDQGRQRQELQGADSFPLQLILLGSLLLAHAAAPLRSRLEETLPEDSLAGSAVEVPELLATLLARGMLSAES